MKVLLDESLPRRLKNDLKEHNVKTVPEAGWQGKKNGELLRLMEKNFDVFITADRNLQYQINLRNTTTPILILVSSTTRYAELKRLVPGILAKLKSGLWQGVERISY